MATAGLQQKGFRFKGLGFKIQGLRFRVWEGSLEILGFHGSYERVTWELWGELGASRQSKKDTALKLPSQGVGACQEIARSRMSWRREGLSASNYKKGYFSKRPGAAMND